MKKIYLIPNVLSSTNKPESFLAPMIGEILDSLDGLFIESVKGTGQLFKYLGIKKHIREWKYVLLNEHTNPSDISSFIKEIADNESWGIISDAGLPGIADPGSLLVQAAHRKNIKVIPLPGPSSIFLGLMASGLTGQVFAFHGYLPRKDEERMKMIKALEKESDARSMSQIFIEAPYRNVILFDELIKHLDDSTRLSVAVDLTGENETIVTKTVREFKHAKPEIPTDFPAIFLFQA